MVNNPDHDNVSGQLHELERYLATTYGFLHNALGVDLLERQEIFLNQSVRGSENAKEASLW